MQPDQQYTRELFDKICHYDDQQAFAELFRLQYKRLHRFSLQYVTLHEKAEEVVNDVFVKLWKYRSTLSSVLNPESYLFIAVKNQSLNYIKKYSHIYVGLPDDENQSKLVSNDNPQQDIEWKEMNFRLNQSIDQLPDQCRKIFKLVKEEGFKLKEVAAILHISTRTVETQLYRAVKRLVAELSDQIKKKQKHQKDN